MWIAESLMLLPLFLLFCVNRILADYPYERTHWSWSCDTNTGRCIKSAQPTVGDVQPLSSYYETLSVCRLTCGRYGALWPKPTGTSVISRQVIEIDPNSFHFDVTNSLLEHIEFFQENVEYFRKRLFEYCEGICAVQALTSVKVVLNVNREDTSLNWNTNESYALDVRTTGSEVTAEISSDTVFGARHGLETLLQLIAPYRLNGAERRLGLVMVTTARIRDKPFYRHRGLLLDTARNFLPVDVVKKQLDGMASTKLNVFHWHATDSQSFPLESQRVPQLSKYGAYSPDQTYTPTDIKTIIDYARMRGIRTIIEIDAPSHSGNGWQFGPELGLGDLAVCINKQPWRQYCIQPPCGQLNPVNPNTYEILADLYRDLLEALPAGETFHMGGDEVFFPCWNSSEEIVEEMKRKGRGLSGEDYLDLWGEFQDKALRTFDSVVGNEKTPVVVWSSLMTEPENIAKYLSPNRYIIQTWTKTTTDLPEVLLQMGYKLIISTKNAWYLDHGFWGTTPYYTWRTAYQNTLPDHPNVLGGEACMWGEYVDGDSVDFKVWPRTAAVGERLWSNPTRDTASAEPRFNAHRERLVRRGLKPDAVTPGWCYQNEGECN